MEPQTDVISNRHLIEGWGVPIDGGVFRRDGQPGIVVDTEKLEKFSVFAEIKNAVCQIQQHMPMAIVILSQKYCPVVDSNYRREINASPNADRFSLGVFLSRKDKSDNEIGGGSADCQALLAALLIEMRFKDDNEGRKVAVIKDPQDGHAMAQYRSKNGDIYSFDPTMGDSKFNKNERT